MKLTIFVLLAMLWSAEGADSENEVVEGRGKAKYALLANLAILVAAKVGLYKLVLATVLVAAGIKMLVVMAWLSAVQKHVPDPYLYYKHTGQKPFDPYTEKIEHEGPVHFFYVVATKLFILKIIYGALFYVLLTKGWHFVAWFIHYLKKNQHEHEFIDDHSFHYDHGHFDHDSFHHQPYGYDKHGVSQSYASDSYGSASAHGSSYGKYKKRVYDSDGSYSVKGI